MSVVALAAALVALALGGCGGDGGGGGGGGRGTAAAGGHTTGSTTTQPAAERHRQRPATHHLTISVSGDLLIHSPVWERALELGGAGGYDFAPLFAGLRPYVERADLAICHVETPMSPAAPSSYPVFNTPPALAKGIAATGWDACDTASNHSVDQGAEGIATTGEALDDAGVRHTGSFVSEAARGRPLILNDHRAKVAYLAYTTDTNGTPPPHSWSVNIASPERILDDARAARRAGADAVVVNLHWGGGIVAEYSSRPSKAQIALAARLTDSPAVTAIVGQGPHVVQPIWRLHDKYVLFSEGNLVSNQGSAVGLPAASQDGYVGLLDLVVRGDDADVDGVSYVPVWVSQPDYAVLPIGDALAGGTGDRAALRASYERTVSVVGRGTGVEVEPDSLP